MKSKRIVVKGYTYETGHCKVRKGSIVILPTADYLKDVLGYTWEGTVTATKSDYTGNCAQILGVKKY